MSNPIRAFRAIKSGFLAIFSSFAILASSITGAAQVTPVVEPVRDQLLNGLNVLFWQRPGDPLVMLKLRIHSGAAFDLAGKAGTMALLSDALFPDPNTREYFTEELGGRIEVATDHDAINITLTGRAAEFERIVDLLRPALVNTPLLPETITKLRDARLKLVSEAGISPTTMADRAIADRLYGDFPYGRPSAGSPEALKDIVRADLVYARDRFLSPNNATLVVIGGLEERRAIRALRQLLGGWRKSDRIVPTTFRQAGAPDARTLVVDLPGAETTEIRLAARSVSRSDRDAAAVAVLTLLARDRWQAASPELTRSAFFVRHEAHVLPGMFVMGAAVRSGDAARVLAAARSVLRQLASAPVPTAEFERAKSEALAVFNKQLEQPESLASVWLDRETFKLPPVSEQSRMLSQLTATDVQRVAAKLFRDAPLAAVALGPAQQLTADLERDGKVELAGTTNKPAPQTPSKSPL